MGTEVELCAEFMAWARGEGHRCYPEWAGWDILVETSDGLQVGVEAKLRGNFKVLAQAIAPRETLRGPDFHAVLVPKASSDFKAVARELRIWVIDWSRKPQFNEMMSRRRRPLPFDYAGISPMRWRHHERHEAPPVEELEKPAGLPSPSGLTWWKVRAIKLCLRLESQGYITSRDFKEFGISARATWIGRWIEWDGTKVGRCHRYVAKEPHPHDPRPDQLHPEVTEALRVEVVDSGATTE